MVEYIFVGTALGGVIGFALGRLSMDGLLMDKDLKILAAQHELHVANKERVNTAAKLAKLTARDAKGRFIKRK